MVLIMLICCVICVGDTVIDVGGMLVIVRDVSLDTDHIWGSVVPVGLQAVSYVELMLRFVLAVGLGWVSMALILVSHVLIYYVRIAQQIMQFVQPAPMVLV